MNKIFILLLAVFSPFVAVPKGFVIKGNVEGLPTSIAMLSYVDASGKDTTITTNITNGAFTFAGEVNEPQLATLKITQGWGYNFDFFLENSRISINMVQGASDKTVITGSASQVVYAKLKPEQIKFFGHARYNKAVQHQYQRNSAALQSADSLWYGQQRQWIQTISSAITKGNEDYAALYFIKWLLFKPDNYDSIMAVFMKLSPAVRQGATAKKFLNEFERLRRISPGQKAPEITGKDTTGKALTLALFKGKVVLLDFWASYCGPCRQENKAMLPMYEKYKPAGLEIVSFSMDNERSAWLRAIQTDGVIWPQVSELRGGASATSGIYDVTDLPRNVLIDRTGKIYAKDLHGDDLIAAIESLLAK